MFRWTLIINRLHDLGQLAKHAAADGIFQHFNALLTFFGEMLDPDHGDVLLDSCLHELLLRDLP